MLFYREQKSLCMKEPAIVKTARFQMQDGYYTFTVECGKTYNVRAEKEEYTTREVSVTIGKLTGKTSLPIALEKSTCKVTIGDDLGKCFGIKMIYFDLDKSNIRTEAALDLEKILDVLNNNPTMKLDIRSHTDSRATHSNTMKLYPTEEPNQPLNGWLKMVLPKTD